MAENSSIEWTDATWNPWQGCTKVSPACANCYMFRDMKRYGQDPTLVRRSAPATFNLPLKTRRGGSYAIAPGSKVFTCSWSDWFHQAADGWRDEAWEIIRQRPDVIFQIVTKRTDRIAQCLPADWGDGWPNVWLIATVENEEFSWPRIEQLIQVPAVVRGLSIEPLLGPLSIGLLGTVPKTISPAYRLLCEFIHWVIVGGESGPDARPMRLEWVRSIVDECRATDVPFFFKQWGEHAPIEQLPAELYDAYQHHMTSGMSDKDIVRVGKTQAGRVLDGRTWDQFPMTEAAS